MILHDGQCIVQGSKNAMTETRDTPLVLLQPLARLIAYIGWHCVSDFVAMIVSITRGNGLLKAFRTSTSLVSRSEYGHGKVDKILWLGLKIEWQAFTDVIEEDNKF